MKHFPNQTHVFFYCMNSSSKDIRTIPSPLEYEIRTFVSRPTRAMMEASVERTQVVYVATAVAAASRRRRRIQRDASPIARATPAPQCALVRSMTARTRERALPHRAEAPPF